MRPFVRSNRTLMMSHGLQPWSATDIGAIGVHALPTAWRGGWHLAGMMRI